MVASALFCIQMMAAIMEKKLSPSMSRSQPISPQTKTASAVLMMRMPIWKW